MTATLFSIVIFSIICTVKSLASIESNGKPGPHEFVTTLIFHACWVAEPGFESW